MQKVDWEQSPTMTQQTNAEFINQKCAKRAIAKM